jgi:8-oxo-dGTP pyrophosphatase MutT (NUDIX family)
MSKRRAELEVSAGGIVFRRSPEEGPRFLLIRDSYDNWGFPKGHLEDGESPAEAAQRETAEETGLEQLVLQGPIRVIDWHFRFRGRHIHKYCHFFLFESPSGEACPQVAEGITDCQWRPLEEALDLLSYDNARGVLKRAGDMVRTLVAVGAGRARGKAAEPAPSAARGQYGGRAEGQGGVTGSSDRSGESVPQEEGAAGKADAVDEPTAVSPYRPTAVPPYRPTA